MKYIWEIRTGNPSLAMKIINVTNSSKKEINTKAEREREREREIERKESKKNLP